MTGMFTDADDNAITAVMDAAGNASYPVTIAKDMSSASAYYTDETSAPSVTLTATSGMMTASVDVEIRSTIHSLSVDKTLAKPGTEIKVSATGKTGAATVTLLDAEGNKVGTTKALDPIGALLTPDGDQEYSRTITIPATSEEDTTLTISLEIGGSTDNSLKVRVVKNQQPPTVSAASATPVGAGGSFKRRSSSPLRHGRDECVEYYDRVCHRGRVRVGFRAG